MVFHQAPPPPVHECGVVCQKVEKSALQLAAAFYQLHIKHGMYWLSVTMKVMLYEGRRQMEERKREEEGRRGRGRERERERERE